MFPLLHFARQDEPDRKKTGKENPATKVTKIPKTKRQKYGVNETQITKIFENLTCHFAMRYPVLSLTMGIIVTTSIRLLDAQHI